MHKTYYMILLLLDCVQGIVVSGHGPYVSLVNYEYVSLSPLILGISQAWLLVSLAAAHTWVQNLKVYLKHWTYSTYSCDIFLIDTFLNILWQIGFERSCTALDFCTAVHR